MVHSIIRRSERENFPAFDSRCVTLFRRAVTLQDLNFKLKETFVIFPLCSPVCETMSLQRGDELRCVSEHCVSLCQEAGRSSQCFYLRTWTVHDLVDLKLCGNTTFHLDGVKAKGDLYVRLLHNLL